MVGRIGFGFRAASVRWGAAGLTLGVVLVGGSAAARDCGGSRPCDCGDRVVESTILVADLGPCPGDGLRVVAGVSLDGGGHAIRGSRPVETSGVTVTDRAVGAFVQNLEVTGFERGLRLAGARGVQVTNVHAHHNGDVRTKVGYGIDLAGGASGNRMERCRIHDNADEGIHFGSRAEGNKLVRSEIRDNFRENVYFLEAVDNVVEDCDVRGGGNDSFYVKNSRGTVIARNRIADRPLTVRGSSTGTVLSDNRVEGTVVLVTDYRDKRTGKTLVPARTTIRGGRISNRASCVRAEAGSGTSIEGVDLDCKEDVSVAGGTVVTGVGRALSVRCAGPGEVLEAPARAPGASSTAVGGDFGGATLRTVRRCDGGSQPGGSGGAPAGGGLGARSQAGGMRRK